MRPLVSVICLTYNHRDLLRQALDGFVMQRADFPFEVIVHDDASKDGTVWIAREYAQRHPGLVRVIEQEENQLRKTGVYPIAHLYRAARGKYVANCDGDDYWTDPLKLRKQADFMERHPETALTHHAYEILQDGKLKAPCRERPRDYSREKLVGFSLDGYGIGSCTKMWRNRYTEDPTRWEAFAGDYPMNVLLGHYGDCRFVEGIGPSVYRRMHASSSWCSLPAPEKNRRTTEIFKICRDLVSAMGNIRNTQIREEMLRCQLRARTR